MTERDPEAEAETTHPRLVEPVMIAAFEGWNDAGEAASTALEHLELMWDAEPLAAIDPEDYYDFQVTRPHVRLADGVTRRIEWQTTRLSWAVLPGTERHVVLVNGIEPNLRWRAFCRELLDHAERLGVTKVITLGALLTDTPHTRPTPVSGTSYDKASAASMGVEPSTLPGPDRHRRRLPERLRARPGIPAISFWAAVPHYVSQARVPKAAVALLHRVEEVLDVEVPLGALPEQAEEWERTVSEMAEADDEVREYVRQLEEQAEESRGRARRPTATRSPPTSSATCAGAAPAARAAERARRRRLARRPALYAGAFLGPFGGGVTVAMLPELGASLRRLGRQRDAVSVTAYLLPFAAVRLVSGTLGERWGRRRTVLRRLCRVYVLASVACVVRRHAGAVPRRPGRCRASPTRSPRRCCSPRSRATVSPERLGRALGWFGSLQAAGQTVGARWSAGWRPSWTGGGLRRRDPGGRAARAGRHPVGRRATRAATGPAHRPAAGRAADRGWSPRWAGAACPV